MTATIKDVAKLACVSPATVSRVLAKKAVSEALKEKVEKAIEETGYRPNLAARRLRAKTSDTIGLIIADIRNPFFTRFARAIDDIAKNRQQHVILCNTDENPVQEKAYLDLMEEENVAGIILSPTLFTSHKTTPIKTTRPLIMIDRNPEAVLYDAVLIDNRQAAAKLVRHLYERGRKNIVCLYGATSSTGFQRQKGYEKAMQDLGLTPKSFPIQHAEESLQNTLNTVFKKSGDVDALIVTNGVMAAKVAACLKKAEIAVPEHLAFAAFDDEPWMELVFNGVTTIAQPVKEIANETYHGLMERIKNPLKPVSQTVLASKLIVRGSTARKGERFD